mmetsp:Transcript_36415/g.104913  ORF Transcript_36415/g.104913 Transcript_36415/m.104913 type:complete len:422 (-) Transcript_36415:193-1458(-)
MNGLGAAGSSARRRQRRKSWGCPLGRAAEGAAAVTFDCRPSAENWERDGMQSRCDSTNKRVSRVLERVRHAGTARAAAVHNSGLAPRSTYSLLHAVVVLALLALFAVTAGGVGVVAIAVRICPIRALAILRILRALRLFALRLLVFSTLLLRVVVVVRGVARHLEDRLPGLGGPAGVLQVGEELLGLVELQARLHLRLLVAEVGVEGHYLRRQGRLFLVLGLDEQVALVVQGEGDRARGPPRQFQSLHGLRHGGRWRLPRAEQLLRHRSLGLAPPSVQDLGLLAITALADVGLHGQREPPGLAPLALFALGDEDWTGQDFGLRDAESHHPAADLALKKRHVARLDPVRHLARKVVKAEGVHLVVAVHLHSAVQSGGLRQTHRQRPGRDPEGQRHGDGLGHCPQGRLRKRVGREGRLRLRQG